jgi:hypothetical protein
MKNFERPLRPEDAGAEPIPFEARTKAPVDAPQSLLAKQEVEEFRSRWDTIQTGFIDEPRKAVKDADALCGPPPSSRLPMVSPISARSWKKQWTQGDQISTEDLRLALQRYRAFFSRLLSL